jgi:predicted AAA+ superfamily ATPase
MSFIESHFATSRRLTERVDTRFQRFLSSQIDWRQPLIFITGMRGVGKTTLLLQHLKRTFAHKPDQALYLTADDVNLSGVRLVDVADEFVARHAGKTLVIDEVHRYPNWNQELKNIFDLQPDLQVLASGSSSLSIVKGQYDLSRRSLVYQLPHLSLREFINLSLGLALPAYGLEQILRSHVEIAPEILTPLTERGTTVLERFRSYLSVGAYPYFQGKEAFDYHRQLVNSITKVLYEDIPSTFDVSAQTPVTFQRLLNFLTTSEPYEPNVDRLAKNLGIARETAYNYLDYLEKSALITFLPRSRSGSKAVRKPAKIYLGNPNLYRALGGVKGLAVKDGTLRESFFLSQVAVRHEVSAPADEGDFEVEGNVPRSFEVGGKGKSRSQLSGPEGYFALDDLEYGLGRSVPLWLFGFLY